MPGLISAFVWIQSISKPEESLLILRFTAETIPSVTVLATLVSDNFQPKDKAGDTHTNPSRWTDNQRPYDYVLPSHLLNARHAALMIGGTEILREMEFLKLVFGSDFTPELYRMLLVGLAMVVVMVWKPRGFVGSREPTAFLKERRAVSGDFTKEGHG